MADSTTLHPDLKDVASQLQVLGLTLDGVLVAIDRAIGDRMACTEYDPPSFAGQTRSARTVRYLREEFVNAGWRPNDAGNYSRLVDDAGAIALAVATGDAATADARFPCPRLAHKKGEMTETAVQRNDEQLTLFPGDDAHTHGGGPLTWILLLNERNDLLHAELSLPRVSANGNIVWWERRIILPPRPLGTPEDVVAPDAAPDDDIPVTRR